MICAPLPVGAGLQERVAAGPTLKVLSSAGRPGLRGEQADIWRTVSAWIWTFYFVGVMAAAMWFAL